MVIINGALAMAVLPANQRVSVQGLQELTETDDVRLATEDEFRDAFPDFELGAMPPLGNIYDMSVYVSPDLASKDEITFNAGTHTDLVRMAWKDYESLVKPRVGSFAI